MTSDASPPVHLLVAAVYATAISLSSGFVATSYLLGFFFLTSLLGRICQSLRSDREARSEACGHTHTAHRLTSVVCLSISTAADCRLWDAVSDPRWSPGPTPQCSCFIPPPYCMMPPVVSVRIVVPGPCSTFNPLRKITMKNAKNVACLESGQCRLLVFLVQHHRLPHSRVRPSPSVYLI